jgi:hypothetical protein
MGYADPYGDWESEGPRAGFDGSPAPDSTRSNDASFGYDDSGASPFDEGERQALLEQQERWQHEDEQLLSKVTQSPSRISLQAPLASNANADDIFGYESTWQDEQ